MDKFQLFLQQSTFKSPILNDAELLYVVVEEKAKKWIFHLRLKEILDPAVLIPFVDQLKSYFTVPKVVQKVDVQITYENETNLSQFACAYYDLAAIELAKEKARFLVLKNFKTVYEDETVFVIVDRDSKFIQPYFKAIANLLKPLGIRFPIQVRIDETLEPTSKLISKSIQAQEKVLEQKSEYARQANQPTVRKSFSRKSSPQAVEIKEVPMDQYRLDQYKNEKGDTTFLIEGTITKLEIRELTNTRLLSFVLYDDDDAITVKNFLRFPKDIEIAEALKDDDQVQVEGNAQFDTFQKDVVIFARAIHFVEKPKRQERMDRAKEKRVEFHVHTKMSNMDGVTDASSYIERAIKWGHEAIAFTDHNGLYAFPEIHQATKNKKIKPIYGVELDFVDEEAFQVVSPALEDIAFKDATFVVFDIETTGLSSARDQIIEIGAVKLKQSGIIEHFQRFVNPQESLSTFTTELTSITDEMLKDAPTIDQVLPEFLAFAEGSILVAHNALFDIGHIAENARKLNIDFPHEYVVDTLNIARYFYSQKLKRFNLKAVAKHFKVKQTQHHRADDDAAVTAQIWLSMMQDFAKEEIRTYLELHQAIDVKEAWKHQMPYHLNVLVQNQAGYKNLFRIVSDALTDHFYNGPRTLKTVLEKYRKGLLVGSGCANGNVFEIALNQDEETLKEAIAFYDYIEVQPPKAYEHLKTDIGQFAEEIIEATLTKIIHLAKAQKKIVIATGDVHYLDKNDVLYREIYIRTPLVGGGIHQLHKYDTMPEQYFLTTEEMLQAFSFLDPELAEEIVVKNTRLLNNQIEYVQAFSEHLYALPDDAFVDQLGIESISGEVKRLVYDQLEILYGNNPHPLVTERLQKELNSIIGNGFAANYYISHLLVKKSLEEGYLVGSRGSVGSSIVATLLNVTEVNPLKPHYRCPNGDFTVFSLTDEEKLKYGLSQEEKAFQPYFEAVQSGYDLPDQKCPFCQAVLIKDGHDIPFETFLGFEGEKVPDIDLNFSGDYQTKAHDYVRELIGIDHTFRAGTIQTVAERNAFGYVKGYLEDKQLEKRPAQIERLAKKIEGVKRSTGQHPGGIVVVPKSKSIFDVTPIQYPADDVNSEWKTTHFDYHSFEDNLLKLDLLGHDDPTMIKYLMDHVYLHPDQFPFNKAQDIPLDDPKVYQLFSGTKVIGLEPHEILSEVASYGIPEFGTSFTRQMLVDTKPTTFAGLVKISGLSHGTDVWLKNAQALINGQTEYGKIPFKDIIGCRDDIMVQLTDFGMLPLKAFEIMEFVRRGKPSKEKAKWLTYEQEMRKHRIPDWYIWSASRIKYMFPKAHATAYVIMAMRIAWFKIYHPLLFYSAFFTKRATQFEYETMMIGSNAIRNRLQEIQKIPNYLLKAKDEALNVTLSVALEMTRRGFKFLPVDIMKSDAKEFIMEENGLRMPFTAIDGLGDQVAEDIVVKRNERAFTSLDDVRDRTRINKTVFEKMESYGAFKDLNSENHVIESGLFAL
ncbi:MAG: PolC-type DNA polymerase III [Acholeplasmataceae bacterium]